MHPVASSTDSAGGLCQRGRPGLTAGTNAVSFTALGGPGPAGHVPRPPVPNSPHPLPSGNRPNLRSSHKASNPSPDEAYLRVTLQWHALNPISLQSCKCLDCAMMQEECVAVPANCVRVGADVDD